MLDQIAMPALMPLRDANGFAARERFLALPSGGLGCTFGIGQHQTPAHGLYADFVRLAHAKEVS